MTDQLLSRQRCFNHLGREAAARCTSCQLYFCRECVIEYEGRLRCTTCLDKLAKSAPLGKSRISALRPWIAAAAGFSIAWLVIYMLGLILMTLPFGEGSMWGPH